MTFQVMAHGFQSSQPINNYNVITKNFANVLQKLPTNNRWLGVFLVEAARSHFYSLLETPMMTPDSSAADMEEGSLSQTRKTKKPKKLASS